jgi:Nucleotidyl transferase AbiEii toxin, Type IV TA system
MNLAQELASLQARGFDEARAELIIMMRESAILLFKAFPDAFLLFGGANLILFHESIRHSADLDLLATSVGSPPAEEIASVLNDGLDPLSKLLSFQKTKAEVLISKQELKKVLVSMQDGKALFTVDLSRMGSVLESAIEEHSFESAATDVTAVVRSVSRNFQLLQKAETFLLRRIIKVRDAYDIKQLVKAGAVLDDNLRRHLEDDLRWEEIQSEQISSRIGQIDTRRCTAELAPILPATVFGQLQAEDFASLRNCVRDLFLAWL